MCIRDSNNTNMWKGANPPVNHMDNDIYATYGMDKPDRHKRESDQFTAVIKNSLTRLVDNWDKDLKNSVAPGVKWFRTSPDHANCKLESGNEREITDPFVLSTLEYDYKNRRNRNSFT